MADVDVAELIRGVDKKKQTIATGEEYDPRFAEDPAMAKAMAALSSRYRNAVQYEPSLSAEQNAMTRRQAALDHSKAAGALVEQYQKGDTDLTGKSMLAKADIAGRKIAGDAAIAGQQIGADAHRYAADRSAEAGIEQYRLLTEGAKTRAAEQALANMQLEEDARKKARTLVPGSRASVARPPVDMWTTGTTGAE